MNQLIILNKRHMKNLKQITFIAKRGWDGLFESHSTFQPIATERLSWGEWSGWLIALPGPCSRDNYVIIFCFCSTDYSCRHSCPTVVAEFTCLQSAQNGRRLTTSQVIWFDQWWYHILGGTPKTGANGRVSQGETHLYPTRDPVTD